MWGIEHAVWNASYIRRCRRHARERPPGSRVGRVRLALPVLLLSHPAGSYADSIRNEPMPPAMQFGQSTSPQRSNASVELTEQASVAIPQGRLLRGAVPSPSGELIVAWFHGEPGVRVYRGAVATDILPDEVGQAVGVGFLDEAKLEIVDAASGDLVVADTDGNLIARRSLPAVRDAGGAARTGTGWFLAFPDSSPPNLRLPASRGHWTPDSTYTRAISLASGDNEVLVWQSFSPFRAWRLGTRTKWVPLALQQVDADWFADDATRSLRFDTGIWSATSVVAVGPGYVQTLAHRGTDQRLLLWFDPAGRFLRYTAVDAPFGLVASAADAPVLLAIRTLNRIELVKYSWETVPNSSGSKGGGR